MPTPRLLLCRHCKVWYTVNRVIPDVCPTCEKSAHWTTAEAMEPKPFRLTQDDKTFLRVNKIAPFDEDDQDDGA